MSLTLSRENGEKLQLVTEGNVVIAITVTNSKGNQVRINFNAPSSRRKMHRELIEDAALRH